MLCLLQILSVELKDYITTATSTIIGTCITACHKLFGKWKRYISDPWNMFDQLMYITMLVAFILRLTLTDDSDFMWARYVYAINVIMFYLRILHLFYISKHLGPEVIVIWRMVCIILLSRYEDMI